MTPIFLLVGILGMTGLVLAANAQVDVKQSTTINGQKTSMKTTDHMCIGDTVTCGTATFMTPRGELSFDNLPGFVLIQYCNDKKCHEYKLDDNGTISEMKR